MIHLSVKPPADSKVATTLAQGFKWLKFEPELEEQFREQHYREIQPRVRIAICLALVTVLGFALMDRWMLGLSPTSVQDKLRYTLHLPIVLMSIVLTGRNYFRKYYLPAISVAAPLFGIGSVLLMMESSGVPQTLMSSRLVLVAFFFYFMLGVSFRTALASNLIVLGSFVLLAISHNIPQGTAIYVFYTLVCANLFAGAGCYALEYANRLAFLERRLLNEVATRDSLTGLLNRGAFEAAQAQVWAAPDRRASSMAVVMLDIDHFKGYNDRYGHQAGDQCLRMVAQAVRRAASRMADIVGRYGGEELIVLLPDSDAPQAQRVAENIVASVRALGIAHANSSTAAIVTVSIGVAVVRSAMTETFESAVRRADNALYAAKDAGRDRWLLAEEGAAAPLDNVVPLLQGKR
jgi:diguanylate cyclase (GGDEF)-like protein